MEEERPWPGLSLSRCYILTGSVSQPPLIIAAFRIKRPALLLLPPLLFPWYRLDFTRLELELHALFWDKAKKCTWRKEREKKQSTPCSLISHGSDEEEAEPAAVPALPSLPGELGSSAAICSLLLINCIFNWAVYLKRKSMVLLAAAWSLNWAFQLPWIAL